MPDAWRQHGFTPGVNGGGAKLQLIAFVAEAKVAKRPADVPLRDHHSERSSTWRAAAEPNLPSLVSISAASRSIASVMASGS